MKPVTSIIPSKSDNRADDAAVPERATHLRVATSVRAGHSIYVLHNRTGGAGG